MVLSIASFVSDDEKRNAINRCFDIRTETLNRCYALPNYRYLPLSIKNKVYDRMKSIVEREFTIA